MPARRRMVLAAAAAAAMIVVLEALGLSAVATLGFQDPPSTLLFGVLDTLFFFGVLGWPVAFLVTLAVAFCAEAVAARRGVPLTRSTACGIAAVLGSGLNPMLLEAHSISSGGLVALLGGTCGLVGGLVYWALVRAARPIDTNPKMSGATTENLP